MRLYDLARVLRSKNSGPYEITLDILFDDPANYPPRAGQRAHHA